jgi:hypothetical protein
MTAVAPELERSPQTLRRRSRSIIWICSSATGIRGESRRPIGRDALHAKLEAVRVVATRKGFTVRWPESTRGVCQPSVPESFTRAHRAIK